MVTYSALDGSEGKHVLGSVAAVSTPGLVARVVSLLQDKLLSLELWVLITHPTRQWKGEAERDKEGERGKKKEGRKRIDIFRLKEQIIRK